MAAQKERNRKRLRGLSSGVAGYHTHSGWEDLSPLFCSIVKSRCAGCVYSNWTLWALWSRRAHLSLPHISRCLSSYYYCRGRVFRSPLSFSPTFSLARFDCSLIESINWGMEKKRDEGCLTAAAAAADETDDEGGRCSASTVHCVPSHVSTRLIAEHFEEVCLFSLSHTPEPCSTCPLHCHSLSFFLFHCLQCHQCHQMSVFLVRMSPRRRQADWEKERKRLVEG